MITPISDACPWTVEYGTVNGTVLCGKPSDLPYVFCREHVRDCRALYPQQPVPLNRNRPRYRSV